MKHPILELPSRETEAVALASSSYLVDLRSLELQFNCIALGICVLRGWDSSKECEIIVMKRVEPMGSREVGSTKKLEAELTGINVGVKKSGLLSRYSLDPSWL